MVHAFSFAAKDPHVIDDLRGPFGLLADADQFATQIVQLRFIPVDPFDTGRGGHADYAKRLVQLMGDAGGHFTQGGEFGGMDQLLLGLAQIGNILG